MSIGGRVYLAFILVVGALTWPATVPTAAVAAGPTRVVVAGVEIPTDISQIVTLGDAVSDAAGNVYFSHATTGGGLRIYKASPAGALTVFAGDGTVPTVPGDGLPAVNVGLSSVSALATDSAGNVYFFDGSRIRKVSVATGKISTIAGNSTSATTSGAGDGSPATSVGLSSQISDVVADTAGNVYYVEPASFVAPSSDLIRKVNASTGLLSTIAGVTGAVSNCSNLTGPTASARFSSLNGLSIDGANNLYTTVNCFSSTNPVVNSGAQILELTPAGQSTVLAGGGTALLGDGAGATAVQLSYPVIHATTAGELYFLANSVLYKITGSVITRVTNDLDPQCGFIDGTLASNLCLADFLFLPSGQLGVVASYPNTGYGVLASGVLGLKTQATNPPDGVDARSSTLPGVAALAVKPDGTIFFAGGTVANVRSISPAYVLGTKAGNGTFANPVFGGPATSSAAPSVSSIATDASGNLFMSSSSYPSLMKVTTSGVLQRFAGTGAYDNGPDGGLAAQTPVTPSSVTTAANGDVYFTTNGYGPCGPFGYCQSASVRKVAATTGVLSTVMADVAGLSLDDLAISPTGSVILAQASTNTELLQLNATNGEVTDLGTIPAPFGSGRSKVAVDSAGTIFVSDGAALWKMTAAGVVTQLDTLFDPSGNVYTVAGDRIVKYPGVAGASNVVTTIADDDIAHAVTHVATDINVATNDTITSGTLAAPTITTPPSAGTATVLPNGHVTYTSQAGFVGTDTFNYSVCGTAAQSSVCDAAVVTVSVVAALPTITAVSDSSTTNWAAPSDLDVRSNDTTTNGTLARPTVSVGPAHGTAAVLSSGAIRYTSEAGFVGTDNLTYSICSFEFPSVCASTTASWTVAAPPATISGTVTLAATGAPQGSGTVYAFLGTSTSPGAVAHVAMDGTYTFSGLATGTYKLVAYPPFGASSAAQAYSGVYTLAAASGIAVVNGDVITGKNFALPVGGSITGTVTDTGGAPLANACMTVTGSPLPYTTTTSACTNASGVYTLSGLASANYVVQFSKTDVAPSYVSEYYNNKTSAISADPVVVTLGATTTHIDAQLIRQGTISGAVSDAVTGQPVTSGLVEAFSGTSTYPTASAYLASNGTYAFNTLAAGSYKLVMYPTSGSGYAPQAYSGASTLAAATAVTVANGVSSTGKNFVLSIGGKISGTVTDGAGAALANACVSLSNSPLPASYFGSPTICTDLAGKYTAPELAPGSYVVQFSKTDVVPAYGVKYYNNKTLANADAVSVTLGTTTANIDASLTENAVISGQLTDSVTGTAASGPFFSVTAVDTTTSASFTGYSYLTPGRYSFELPPGTYKMSAVDSSSVYATQYFDHKPSLGLADAVTTTAGATRTIDFALVRNPAIRGTVTSASGVAIPNVSIGAYSASSSSSPIASTTTAADGTYSLAVPTGSYLVKATDPTNVYVAQWYSNASSFDTGSILALGTSDLVANFALALGGTFSGTVTRGGVAVPSGYVYIYQGNAFIATVYIDAQGKYSSPALAPGSYVAYSTSFYYNGASSLAAATPIVVTASHVTTNIDFALLTGAISGTALDATTSLPVSNGQVYAYLNGNYVRQTYVHSDGQFTLSDLAPGTYKVFASANGYQSLYYNNQTTLAAATPVTVTTTALTGYNFALSTGVNRAFVGTITDDQTHAALSNACVSAIDTTTFQSTGICTGADGKYQLTVPPGNYSLDITAPRFVEKRLAGPFSITSGSSIVTDVAMSLGGTISGTVTDQQTGAPLRNVCVYLLDAATNVYANGFTCTAADGTFSAVGLTTRSYATEPPPLRRRR